MKQELMDAILETPVIAAVKDDAGLRNALTNENIRVVFVLYGDICNISSIVRRIHEAGRFAVVHVDLIAGLAGKEVAVDFIRNTTEADGIISSRQSFIRRAKELGLAAILRVFLLDSIALESLDKIPANLPDCLDLLPGAMPKILRRVCAKAKVTVLTGGLLAAKEDVLAALAQVAAENNYCRPVVDDSDVLTITEGRHPVVEQVLKGSMFVPNDTTLNCTTDRCLIITGPNMAGKSTYMRQNALIALMAQIGSFVPARECHVGVVDAIFTRIGASDDLAAGQSTFMVEMTEVAEILKNATSRSLVVLDEIGRGTSTFDGMSIARAVVEHIADPAKGLGCKTLFATHYHELTELEGTVEGVKNYNIAVKKRGEDITFLRRIVRGPADDSYGIEVAKLAGLPGSVTRRAHEVLRTLEASAPKNKVEQMDFDALQEYNSPAVPSEMMEKLEAVDVETLTPIEALNFLYELKKTLKGSLNG